MTIGNKTLRLLDETVSFMQDVIGKAAIIEVPNETTGNFLLELDPSHFEMRRNIMCQLCDVNFSLAYISLMFL